MKKNIIKNKYLIISILTILVLLITGTLAWNNLQTKKTAMVFTIGSLDDVQISLSPHELDITTSPVLTYTGMTDYVSVTATNSNISNNGFNLYYKINEIDTNLVSSDMKYVITKSTDGTNFVEYLTGDFSTAISNAKMTILNGEELLPSSVTYYRLYTYLDGNSANQANLQGKNMDLSIYADVGVLKINYSDMINNYSCANENAGNDPLFTYTGNCAIEQRDTDDWVIKFLTSGDLIFSKTITIDAFLVGGGGGGAGYNRYGSQYSTSYIFSDGGPGGAGGSTLTKTNINIENNTTYSIVVGDGGAGGTNSANGSNGQASTAFGFTAAGGTGGSNSGSGEGNRTQGGNGGSGGGSGGHTVVTSAAGGSNGNDGNSAASSIGGIGQGTTTCEFGEGTSIGCNTGVTLYAGGGGGGKNWSSRHGESNGGSGGAGGGGNGNASTVADKSGVANTGGGGGGGQVLSTSSSNLCNAGNGGSGIVIIRNAKEDEVLTASDTLYGFYFRTGNKNHFCGSDDSVCHYIDEGSGNWKIEFYTSGKIHFFNNKYIDAFLVGGGGGGSNNIYYGSIYSSEYYFSDGGAGGGGGYTLTQKNIYLLAKDYEIVIGSGGKGAVGTYGTSGSNGQATTAFGFTASGGKGGEVTSSSTLQGGAGGSGGGAGGTRTTASAVGGSYGNNGNSTSSHTGGNGQGTTTCEFGEGTLTECNSGVTLYAGGGGGGKNWSSRHGESNGGAGGDGGGGNGNADDSISKNGVANTGGGGGGGHELSSNNTSHSNGGAGGSGILVIRNARN